MRPNSHLFPILFTTTVLLGFVQTLDEAETETTETSKPRPTAGMERLPLSQKCHDRIRGCAKFSLDYDGGKRECDVYFSQRQIPPPGATWPVGDAEADISSRKIFTRVSYGEDCAEIYNSGFKASDAFLDYLDGLMNATVAEYCRDPKATDHWPKCTGLTFDSPNNYEARPTSSTTITTSTPLPETTTSISPKPSDVEEPRIKSEPTITVQEPTSSITSSSTDVPVQTNKPDPALSPAPSSNTTAFTIQPLLPTGTPLAPSTFDPSKIRALAAALGASLFIVLSGILMAFLLLKRRRRLLSNKLKEAEPEPVEICGAEIPVVEKIEEINGKTVKIPEELQGGEILEAPDTEVRVWMRRSGAEVGVVVVDSAGIGSRKGSLVEGV